MNQPIRTLLFGVGAIGVALGRLITGRSELVPVGAVDSAPDKAGRPLYETPGVAPPKDSGLPTVEGNAESALATARPEVVLDGTGSYLPDVFPHLLACVRAGANVISTCEELSYPWQRHPELARQLDLEAKARGVTVLGAGVNPGFVMDTLAAALSGVCQRVERVRVARIVDVATRRPQLQRKVGMGLTVKEFEARAAAGRFGHVGLQESCWMLAAGLGWRLETLEECIEPVVGVDGNATGMRQTAIGTMRGRPVIEAEVQMSAGAERPRDEIEIEGAPPVRMIIDGGIQGDLATAAVVVNAIPRVVGHPAGLVTMLDLPLVTGKGETQ